MIDAIKKYVELRLELLKLSFVEKTSLLLGKIVLLGVVGIFIFIFLALFLVLIHNLFMAWIGIQWVVSLVMIGVLGMIFLVVWLLRYPMIIRPVANMIIKEAYDASDDDNDDDDDIDNNEK